MTTTTIIGRDVGLFVCLGIVGVAYMLYMYTFLAYTAYKHRRHTPSCLDNHFNIVFDPSNHVDLLCTMRVLHKQLEMLKIPYWVSSGTMLGLERHGSIIPYDDDIDIAVPEEYKPMLLAKLENLRESMLGGGLTKYRLPGKSAFVDVFWMRKHDPADGEPFYAYTDVARQYFPQQEWLVRDVWPLRHRLLNDVVVCTPRNAVPNLRKAFGASWDKELRFHAHSIPGLFYTLFKMGRVVLTPELNVCMRMLGRQVTSRGFCHKAICD